MNNFSDIGETQEPKTEGATGQSRPNAADVGWLAGVLDGEGCLTLAHRSGRQQTVRTLLYLGNTSKELLDKAQRVIFEITGFKVNIRLHHPAGYDKRTRDFYSFYLDRQVHVRKVCEAVLPHLTEKRRQAEIVVQFCLRRKTQTATAQYGAEELGLIAEMDVLFNRRQRGLETEREAPAPKRVGATVRSS